MREVLSCKIELFTLYHFLTFKLIVTSRPVTEIFWGERSLLSPEIPGEQLLVYLIIINTIEESYFKVEEIYLALANQLRRARRRAKSIALDSVTALNQLWITKLINQITLQNCLFVHDTLNYVSPICFQQYFQQTKEIN